MRLPYCESCSPSRRHRRCPPVQPVRSRLRAEQLDRVGKTEELHGVFLHNFAWCFDCHCHLEPLFDAGAYQGWSPSAPVSQSQQCRYRQQLLPARVSEAAVIARIVPVAFRQMAPSVFRTAIQLSLPFHPRGSQQPAHLSRLPCHHLLPHEPKFARCGAGRICTTTTISSTSHLQPQPPGGSSPCYTRAYRQSHSGPWCPVHSQAQASHSRICRDINRGQLRGWIHLRAFHSWLGLRPHVSHHLRLCSYSPCP
jgi:hypothetical protein